VDPLSPIANLSAGPGIIFVTNGNVSIQQVSQATSTTRVPAISIFAEQVGLLGPESPDLMDLVHTPGGTTTLDAIIDQLYAAGALPNAPTNPKGTFNPIAGAWRPVTESSPN
jgi:hypothetical protein